MLGSPRGLAEYRANNQIRTLLGTEESAAKRRVNRITSGPSRRPSINRIFSDCPRDTQASAASKASHRSRRLPATPIPISHHSRTSNTTGGCQPRLVLDLLAAQGLDAPEQRSSRGLNCKDRSGCFHLGYGVAVCAAGQSSAVRGDVDRRPVRAMAMAMGVSR